MGPFLSPYHHILCRATIGMVIYFKRKSRPRKGTFIFFVRSMQNSPFFTYVCQLLFTWQNTALLSARQVEKQGLSLIVSIPSTRVINHPKHKSICYHPSLLPRHRGASAINWTLMEGDRKGGFSIFWADDGLDTGPILLQRECYIGENDTVDSVYNGFMYPVGKPMF